LIAIYSVAGHDQKMIAKKDLRGITWEVEFPPDSQIVIHHISDGPLYVNGINFTVLPEGSAAYREKQVRLITKECWKHFVKNHPHVPWFLRGFFDMFVNVTNLRKFLHELNAQYHPQDEWVARYGCANHEGIDYPHGSTGHLFSNSAVRTLLSNIAIFDACPERHAEDICVRFTMNALRIPFYASCSDYFVVGFPDVSLSTYSVMTREAPRCPTRGMISSYSLIMPLPCPVPKAVTVHMHAVRMDKWMDYLHGAAHLALAWIPKEFGYPGVHFCVPQMTIGAE
jgi:hypothetical protein